jgi:hypothetical protein
MGTIRQKGGYDSFRDGVGKVTGVTFACER